MRGNEVSSFGDRNYSPKFPLSLSFREKKKKRKSDSSIRLPSCACTAKLSLYMIIGAVKLQMVRPLTPKQLFNTRAEPSFRLRTVYNAETAVGRDGLPSSQQLLSPYILQACHTNARDPCGK